jgi:hypothetical protein
MTTFPYDVPDQIRLRGLSLAIHTLKQLTTNQGSNIIDIANKYDSDQNFVMSVIDFLKDIRGYHKMKMVNTLLRNKA